MEQAKVDSVKEWIWCYNPDSSFSFYLIISDSFSLTHTEGQ